MNLISVSLLSILIYPVFAGLAPAERQTSLLGVVSPMYQQNEDVRLTKLSEAQLWFKASSDEDTPDNLELGPSLKSTLFSIYKSVDKEENNQISALLTNAPDFDSFIHLASLLRYFINPTTFCYATKTAAFGRDDLSDLWFPPLWQTNSRSFFTEKNIAHAVRWNAPKMDNENFNTGTYTDPEYRTAWFREDIGLNEMHGKISALEDLQGVDTFHFFTQLLARYEAERFAAGLPKVKQFKWGGSEDKEPIPEGYDPHLSTPLGNSRFAARPAGMNIQDDLRDPENPQKDDLFVYCFKQLTDSIRSGFATEESGEKVPITMELINQMINGPAKGIQFGCKHGIHSLGHNLLSIVTDPDGRYKQEIGVLGIPETAMRDPTFYTYHRLIYSLYDMYQMSLPAYSKSDFEFPGISVNDVSVISMKTGQSNMLDTFMESAETQILYDPTVQRSKNENDPVALTLQRLNHDDFEYIIKVNNDNPNGNDVQAAVRIFIAPHNDDTRTPFRLLNEQRRFFIEMDKFIVTLNKGDNVIKRSSTLSSVSFPSVDTFEDWSVFVNTHGLRRDRFTGCGWPANILLPRGTPEGMFFDLFVMLTDWSKDQAETADRFTVPNLDFGSSLCGVKGSEYPDGKSRGFPFDRKFEGYQVDLADFAGDYDNVFVGSLKITHDGKNAKNEK